MISNEGCKSQISSLLFTFLWLDGCNHMKTGAGTGEMTP